MNVDEWIYTTLDAAITDVDGRITPEIGDQETAKPYLVYKLIAEGPIATHDIPLQLTRNWHYDICAIAETDSAARTLGESAKAALVGQQGGGIQSVILSGGTRKGYDMNTRDFEYSFGISIWENLV